MEAPTLVTPPSGRQEPQRWTEPQGDPRPSGTTRSLAVVTLAVTAVLTALVLVPSVPDDVTLGQALLHLAVVLVPLTMGAYAALWTPSVRFGHLLMAAALVWSLTMLSESENSVVYSTGRVATWLIWPVLGCLMLSFPDGRLPGRRERVLFGTLVALILLMYVGSALLVDEYPTATPFAQCGDDCPSNAFMIAGTEPAFVDSFLTPGRELLGALLLTAVNATLVFRVRAASRIRALTMAPVIVTSIISNALVIGFLVARNLAPDGDLAEDLGVAWALSLPAIAVAFAVGLLQRRLLIASVLSGLALALRASVTTRQVTAGLRSAIGDPTVEVLAHDPASDTWTHENGAVADPTELQANGLVVRTIGGGEPVAALVVGGDLGTDEELIDAIVSLTETSLREMSLLSRLEASLHELDESRKRIATAADVERRRIERDLHDGAQQRLIALRIRLSLAEDLLREDPRMATKAVHDLGDAIDHALEEIRSLAHGVYPALLADRGLTDALAGAARRLPLPVSVDAEGLTRHTPEVESAVYFSCLEALQNVVKHARGATGARVVLHQHDVLTFEVVDDGEGFDAQAVRSGHGLENMHDRVESLGGTLTVLVAPGKGTAIRGAIPLRARDDAGGEEGDAPGAYGTTGAAPGRQRLAP